MTLRAITLDLDDTLWPIWPTIARAEARLLDWLHAAAPATAALHDSASLRRLRDTVAAERPHWAHDLSAIRHEAIRRALQAAGDDPVLADAGFEVFHAERQRVELFVDVLPALERLASRFPLVALSNGNADLQRIAGLARYFRGGVSAREFGVGKPAPAIFHEACRRAGCAPALALHVGDDAAIDVDGALGAGLQAAWVRRESLASPGQPAGVPQMVVADLAALADALGV